MTQPGATWIVLARDTSDSVGVEGQRRTFVAVVLDADTGMVVHTMIGTGLSDVVRRGLKAALVTPAPPTPKTVPGRLVCPPELTDAVRAAVAKLSKLATTEIAEGVQMWDSEEILDSLIGHMEGRVQPVEPPEVADWQLLYDVLGNFTAAEPWLRWHDQARFRTVLQLDGETYDWISIVLGGGGVQHGFNVVREAGVLEVMAAAEAAEDALEAMERSLVVHLNRRRETFGVFAYKGTRYGWPQDMSLVPTAFTIRDRQVADLSQTDLRLLVMALQGVLLQDAKGLAAAGESTLAGEVEFEDGTVGSYEVTRPL